VHGKNHYRDGSFGAPALAIRLAAPDGTVEEIGPGDALFDATVGGMGLIGLILEVTVRLIPVTSAYLQVRPRGRRTSMRSWRYSRSWTLPGATRSHGSAA
jgi:decaprenylphospho-beta-D-ribofuranose 2-oxidase